MSNFDRFSPGSHRDHTLTRDDHIALLRGPEIYGRRERLGVALQLDILSQVTAHQLVRYGQHRRDCKDTRHIIEGFVYVIYVYTHKYICSIVYGAGLVLHVCGCFLTQYLIHSKTEEYTKKIYKK